MFDVLLARWRQGHRTMRYPAGPPPELPERFAGRPTLDAAKCTAECQRCVAACPTGAIGFSQSGHNIQLDIGRCLFCRQCETACGEERFSSRATYRMAASRREVLIVRDATQQAAVTLAEASRRLFGRSLKLRQVSAGGCNACEADTNVLGTVAWDLGRFGIQFVASPRHADGLLVTGPVTENMRLALRKTYDAVAWPKLVIAVGDMRISGGPYVDHAEVHNGGSLRYRLTCSFPVVRRIRSTILDGLLTMLRQSPTNRFRLAGAPPKAAC